MHKALRSICQGSVVGDAEMLLFYAFRGPDTGDLQAGTIHGHSKHNNVNFGGEELGKKYGEPWSEFAEEVIPRPDVEPALTVSVNADGAVTLPILDIETVSLQILCRLLRQFFEQSWRVARPEAGIPWDRITSEPAKFYDINKFAFPVAVKESALLTTAEALMMFEFLASMTNAFAFSPRLPTKEPAAQPSPSPPKPTAGQEDTAITTSKAVVNATQPGPDGKGAATGSSDSPPQPDIERPDLTIPVPKTPVLPPDQVPEPVIKPTRRKRKR
ncbi:hypothetical protein FB45DRAFT_216895 [Roridomyces roridus]|uniref:Uncharacterized protein n=1 Tax=Roridomyces roridus TaxID=1738132 RepID=A0AAD7BE58_9AGAR|nr:hypothetical protein FB45DRAFT_216895 [Roridomyces roridus]